MFGLPTVFILAYSGYQDIRISGYIDTSYVVQTKALIVLSFCRDKGGNNDKISDKTRGADKIIK